MCTAEKLSLGHTRSRPVLQGIGRLPCGADDLLVRESYRELYGILVADQEDRMKHVQAGERIPNWKTFTLILGQPGIGKTWFLSYVLVRRLLERKPTIFQAVGYANDDVTVTAAIHYLTSAKGVHPTPDAPSAPEFMDPEIWVFADHHPVGAARRPGHKWLVFFFWFIHYSHATYGDHGEIMYSLVPVHCLRSGGT